ncbi:MAG TPA: KamA family radical SAM protein [Myxococcota bacterium]|nr:KamA family radical SAM protein [Oligoflexales bacterium]HPC92800.1 KamA family radical SAM protein [Myxococcota bacterium]HQI61853.1 KamA family radical SAM protein [Myxococcota bacterium]HRV18678.1 KamA family radical SAM protein [Myxococcota bacterium]
MHKDITKRFPEHILAQFPPAPRGPWADVPDKDWENWHWHLQRRIKDVEGMEQVINLSDDELNAAEATKNLFDIGIPPYYAALMDRNDPGCPIRLQATPRMAELTPEEWEMEDPLAEERDMPVQGVTHRYPDRVLFYITQNCAMFCRHCTRKRKVADPSTAANDEQIDAGIEYIASNPKIRDIVVSGGDPMTWSDNKLEKLLSRLRAIPHVEILRVGTRTPVTLPLRITEDVAKMLAQFHPIYVNTHFNHPKECTREAFIACQRLADHGIPIGNQMVLLKGVNDDPATVMRLNHLLLMMRVKPYYIFQCDLNQGNAHLRTTVDKGLEIMEKLRGWTSGLAIPYYVIDAPGGGGKVPILPNYVVSREPGKTTIRNFKGTIHVYPEPHE